MLEAALSTVALIIAGLAYYRTTRGQLPTVDLIALNEDPDFPDWQLRIHNPTARPIYLSRIRIHEPAPETVWSIRPEGVSRRGDIERSYRELDGAPSGSNHRRVREIHLRIDPETTGVLCFDINRTADARGEPRPYSLRFDLKWSHKLPFPDGWLFVLLHRQIAKTADELEAIRLGARRTP